MDDNMHSFPDSRSYVPAAVYYEESDSLEYIRRDGPCVYRRIDNLLTLVLELDSREPMGFQIKGFKHYYFRTIRTTEGRSSFNHLIEILQFALTKVGDGVFKREDRIRDYERALNIADEDKVRIPEIPIRAASH